MLLDSAPRPIEELTGTMIARHYALAWRDMAGALGIRSSRRPQRRICTGSQKIALSEESVNKIRWACTFGSSIMATS